MEYDQAEADSLRWQVQQQKLADDRRISRNAPWVHPDNRIPDDYEDDDVKECQRCHGDGRDPWNDHILPCPECSDEA